MKCPVDGETLLLTSRSGVEIDYCPKCRGVWLDRGELDKLIEREDDDREREFEERRASYENRPPDPRAYESRDRGEYRGGYDARRDERPYRRDHDDNPLEMLKDVLGKKTSGGYDSHGYKKKKKGGLLGDLFDF